VINGDQGRSRLQLDGERRPRECCLNLELRATAGAGCCCRAGGGSGEAASASGAAGRARDSARDRRPAVGRRVGLRWQPVWGSFGALGRATLSEVGDDGLVVCEAFLGSLLCVRQLGGKLVHLGGLLLVLRARGVLREGEDAHLGGGRARRGEHLHAGQGGVRREGEVVHPLRQLLG
jgi:hypothetical protein